MKEICLGSCPILAVGHVPSNNIKETRGRRGIPTFRGPGWKTFMLFIFLRHIGVSIFEFSFSMAFVLSFSLQPKKIGPDRPSDGEVMIVLCDGSHFRALRSKTYGKKGSSSGREIRQLNSEIVGYK